MDTTRDTARSTLADAAAAHQASMRAHQVSHDVALERDRAVARALAAGLSRLTVADAIGVSRERTYRMAPPVGLVPRTHSPPDTARVLQAAATTHAAAQVAYAEHLQLATLRDHAVAAARDAGATTSALAAALGVARESICAMLAKAARTRSVPNSLTLGSPPAVLPPSTRPVIE